MANVQDQHRRKLNPAGGAVQKSPNRPIVRRDENKEIASPRSRTKKVESAATVHLQHKPINDSEVMTEEKYLAMRRSRSFSDYVHARCSCTKFFTATNEPCVQKCGITLCQHCNKTPTNCETCCPEKAEIRAEETTFNRDLANNYSLILTALKEEGLFATQEKEISKVIEVGDDVMQVIENECKPRRSSKKESKTSWMITEMDLENAFISLIRVLNPLKYLGIVLGTTIDEVSLNKQLTKNEEFLQTLKDDLANLEAILYESLTKTPPGKDVCIGLRTIDFPAKKLSRDLSQSNLTCFACSDKKEVLKYYPVVYYDKYFSVGHPINLTFQKKNCFLVDYEHLIEAHEMAGFFLQLQYEIETHYIEIYFTPEEEKEKKRELDPLQRQIVSLCSGDQGLCYIGGYGISTDEIILIKGYYDGNKCLSEDIIPEIPNDPAMKGRPSLKGFVWVTRNYGEEASISIRLRHHDEGIDPPIRREEYIIGNVNNFASLEHVPEGSFTIGNSGLLLRFKQK